MSSDVTRKVTEAFLTYPGDPQGKNPHKYLKLFEGLKILPRKGDPARLRVKTIKIKGLHEAIRADHFLHGKNYDRSAILHFRPSPGVLPKHKTQS